MSELGMGWPSCFTASYMTTLDATTEEGVTRGGVHRVRLSCDLCDWHVEAADPECAMDSAGSHYQAQHVGRG